MEASAAPTLPGYRLGGAFASGAGGPIWAARDRDGIPVLVRRVPTQGRDRRAIVRRIATLGAHPHPSLVGVRESVEQSDGELVVALTLADGPTLAQLGAARGALGGDVVARIVADLASALAHLHHLGLAHGDLSPHNVAITRGGAVLLDVLDGVAATPGFVAPERASGRAATPASDVWELAALVAWALQGSAGPGGPETPSSRPAALPDTVGSILDRASGPAPGRPPAAQISAVADAALVPDGDASWRASVAVDLPEMALGTLRAAALVAPTLAPPRRRLPAARWVVGGGAVVVAGAVALVVVVSGHRAPSTVAVDPAAVMAALETRDHALASGDGASLALAVEPGSPAWENDTSIVAALDAAATRIPGLRSTVRVVEGSARTRPDGGTVEVLLRQEAHVRWQEGEPRWVEAQPERCVALETVERSGSALIRDFGPCEL